MAKRKSKGMTMPMRVLESKNIPYELHQHSRKQFTAEGVASDLGVDVAQVVKAMLIERSESLPGSPKSHHILVVIPGDRRLSLKIIGIKLGDKKVKLASGRDVERVTGFQLGAVSVAGFRRSDVPSYLDKRVLEFEQIIISSGRSDSGLAVSPNSLTQVLEGVTIGDFCKDL